MATTDRRRHPRARARRATVPVPFCALIGAVLLLAAGCGEQDRYVLMPPEMQLAALSTEGWVETAVIPAVNSNGWSAALMLDDGDLLLSDYSGRVFRFRDDRFTDTGWSAGDAATGLARLSDGTVYGVSHDGAVLTYDGVDWSVETDLGVGWIRRMVPGRMDRLLAFGSGGTIRLLEGGAWHDHDLETDAYLVDVRDDPQLGLLAVDANRRFYREDGRGWIVSDPFVEDEWPTSQAFFCGDDLGHLAVATRDGSGYWLWYDDAWHYEPLPIPEGHIRDSVRDLFWRNGQLYVWRASDNGICRLDGDDWQPITAGSADWYGPRLAIDLDACRYFIGANGQLARFCGGAFVDLLPPIGTIRGVAAIDEDVHVLTSYGCHLRRDGGGWRLLGRPLTEVVWQSDLSSDLLTDDRGGLVMHGQSELISWHDGLYESVIDDHVELAISQYDGSLLVLYNGRLGRLSRGEMTWLGGIAASWRSADDLARTADGAIWILQDNRVGQYTDGEVVPRLAAAGWEVKGLMTDPYRGLVVYGRGGVVLHDDEGFHEMTPWLGTGQPSRPVRLYTLCLDGQGRWIGWEFNSQEFLRYDGVDWLRVLPANVSDLLRIGSQAAVVPAPGSDVWLWDDLDLVRFHVEASP